MANKTFNDLPVIETTNAADKIPVWDTSAAQASAITVANLVDDINGGVDIAAHVNNAAIHRQINDSGSGATDLWSASKIATEIENAAVEGAFMADGSVPMTGDINTGNNNLQLGSGIVNSADGNTVHYFGRAALGYADISDVASFSHRDRTGAGAAAVRQLASGQTQINSVSGTPIVFSVANSEKARLHSDGKFSIGGVTPDSLLHIWASSAGTITADTSTLLAIEKNGDASLEFLNPNNQRAYIVFSKPSGSFDGYIAYSHGSGIGHIEFGVNNLGTRYEMHGGHFGPTVDDAVDCGSSGSRWNDIWAGNGTIVTSDAHDKEAIADSDLGLAFVEALRPVRYKHKGRKRPHYGFVAQDVAQTIESMDHDDFAGYVQYEDEKGNLRHALRYSEFIGPLVAAVQDLARQVRELQDHGK